MARPAAYESNTQKHGQTSHGECQDKEDTDANTEDFVMQRIGASSESTTMATSSSSDRGTSEDEESLPEVPFLKRKTTISPEPTNSSLEDYMKTEDCIYDSQLDLQLDLCPKHGDVSDCELPSGLYFKNSSIWTSSGLPIGFTFGTLPMNPDTVDRGTAQLVSRDDMVEVVCGGTQFTLADDPKRNWLKFMYWGYKGNVSMFCGQNKLELRTLEAIEPNTELLFSYSTKDGQVFSDTTTDHNSNSVIPEKSDSKTKNLQGQANQESCGSSSGDNLHAVEKSNQIKPDNIQNQHDKCQSQPDNSQTQHDNSQIQPDNSQIQPDNNQSQPDNSQSQQSFHEASSTNKLKTEQQTYHLGIWRGPAPLSVDSSHTQTRENASIHCDQIEDADQPRLSQLYNRWCALPEKHQKCPGVYGCYEPDSEQWNKLNKFPFARSDKQYSCPHCEEKLESRNAVVVHVANVHYPFTGGYVCPDKGCKIWSYVVHRKTLIKHLEQFHRWTDRAAINATEPGTIEVCAYINAFYTPPKATAKKNTPFSFSLEVLHDAFLLQNTNHDLLDVTSKAMIAEISEATVLLSDIFSCSFEALNRKGFVTLKATTSRRYNCVSAVKRTQPGRRSQESSGHHCQNTRRISKLTPRKVMPAPQVVTVLNAILQSKSPQQSQSNSGEQNEETPKFHPYTSRTSVIVVSPGQDMGGTVPLPTCTAQQGTQNVADEDRSVLTMVTPESSQPKANLANGIGNSTAKTTESSGSSKTAIQSVFKCRDGKNQQSSNSGDEICQKVILNSTADTLTTKNNDNTVVPPRRSTPQKKNKTVRGPFPQDQCRKQRLEKKRSMETCMDSSYWTCQQEQCSAQQHIDKNTYDVHSAQTRRTSITDIEGVIGSVTVIGSAEADRPTASNRSNRLSSLDSPKRKRQYLADADTNYPQIKDTSGTWNIENIPEKSTKAESHRQNFASSPPVPILVVPLHIMTMRSQESEVSSSNRCPDMSQGSIIELPTAVDQERTPGTSCVSRKKIQKESNETSCHNLETRGMLCRGPVSGISTMSNSSVTSFNQSLPAASSQNENPGSVTLVPVLVVPLETEVEDRHQSEVEPIVNASNLGTEICQTSKVDASPAIIQTLSLGTEIPQASRFDASPAINQKTSVQSPLTPLILRTKKKKVPTAGKPISKNTSVTSSIDNVQEVSINNENHAQNARFSPLYVSTPVGQLGLQETKLQYGQEVQDGRIIQVLNFEVCQASKVDVSSAVDQGTTVQSPTPRTLRPRKQKEGNDIRQQNTQTHRIPPSGKPISINTSVTSGIDSVQEVSSNTENHAQNPRSSPSSTPTPVRQLRLQLKKLQDRREVQSEHSVQASNLGSDVSQLSKVDASPAIDQETSVQSPTPRILRTRKQEECIYLGYKQSIETSTMPQPGSEKTITKKTEIRFTKSGIPEHDVSSEGVCSPCSTTVCSPSDASAGNVTDFPVLRTLIKRSHKAHGETDHNIQNKTCEASMKKQQGRKTISHFLMKLDKKSGSLSVKGTNSTSLPASPETAVRVLRKRPANKVIQASNSNSELNTAGSALGIAKTDADGREEIVRSSSPRSPRVLQRNPQRNTSDQSKTPGKPNAEQLTEGPTSPNRKRLRTRSRSSSLGESSNTITHTPRSTAPIETLTTQAEQCSEPTSSDVPDCHISTTVDLSFDSDAEMDDNSLCLDSSHPLKLHGTGHQTVNQKQSETSSMSNAQNADLHKGKTNQNRVKDKHKQRNVSKKTKTSSGKSLFVDLTKSSKYSGKHAKSLEKLKKRLKKHKNKNTELTLQVEELTSRCEAAENTLPEKVTPDSCDASSSTEPSSTNCASKDAAMDEIIAERDIFRSHLMRILSGPVEPQDFARFTRDTRRRVEQALEDVPRSGGLTPETQTLPEGWTRACLNWGK